MVTQTYKTQTCEFHYITQKILHSEGATEVPPILKHYRAQSGVRMPAGCLSLICKCNLQQQPRPAVIPLQSYFF